MRTIVLGSTSGIGRAVALALAASGADVIVHGRSSRKAAEDVAGLVREMGRKSAVLLADLADRSAGETLVQDAWSLWGGLDAWLHLAGADTLTGAGAKLSFDAKLDLLWSVDVACDDPALPRRRPAHGLTRLGLDRHDGMGPGRDGHGR